MPRGTPKTEGKSQHQRRTASRVYTHTHTTEASFAQLSRPRDPRLICAHRRSVKARGSRGTGCVCVAWGRAVYPPRPSRALGEGRIKVAETRALWGREHIARVRRNASLSIALHCPRPISPIGEIQGRSLRSGRFNNCETLPPPPPAPSRPKSGYRAHVATATDRLGVPRPPLPGSTSRAAVNLMTPEMNHPILGEKGRTTSGGLSCASSSRLINCNRPSLTLKKSFDRPTAARTRARD